MTSPQELPLDHIVIAVADLARTIIDYRALGFTVVEGGKHSLGDKVEEAAERIAAFVGSIR